MHAESSRLVLDVKLSRAGFAIDVQLDVKPGVTVLFGPSGSGKSTTLEMIAGLVRPDAGRIVLGERVLFDERTDLAAHRRRIGLVFQSIALFPHRSVLDNVTYGIRGATTGSRRERALRWLDRMRVAHLASRSPATLSGGEAQRVALARALAAEPRALLLDEPFSSLDSELRDELSREIRLLVDDLSLPTVLVTHDRDEASALGDAAVVLREGRVVAAGAPSAIIGRARSPAGAPTEGAA